MADYIEAASVEADGSVAPRWRAYCRVVEQAIGLVRAGKLQRQRTGEFLRALGGHYFIADDPQSRFSIDIVIRAFARATNNHGRHLGVLEGRSDQPGQKQGQRDRADQRGAA
jgi:hypothetical protein